MIELVPSAVALDVKDRFCHLLQGQRISCRASASQQGAGVSSLRRDPFSVVRGPFKREPGNGSRETDNVLHASFSIVPPSYESGVRTLSKAAGDVIFTKYGLSGTAILDISEEISIAINREGAKNIGVSIDMVPFMEEGALSQELARRIQKGIPNEELLAGILPNKFSAALKDLLNKKDCTVIAHALKNKQFKVSGTRGWNEAEFTAGGVDTQEVNEFTLESKLKKGLYFAGEILDVQGRRGGYNLGWAWASGWVAGLTE
ncbi:MAG: NAD(P)/FAD-dependent oxidoreductase [Planctomycetes bacterium]|nr:NAD(P)/FAD-dependent oxidoreductase [Planctomycetota bacterium]